MSFIRIPNLKSIKLARCIKKSLLAGVFILFSLLSTAQVFEDATAAFQESSKSGKPVLLIFSGSDWCAPCIQLEKRIFSQETFLSFARDHLIILRADFPQRKKISKSLQHQNDSLAERYNAQGIFPHVLLLNHEGIVNGVLDHQNESPDDFIAQIRTCLLKMKNAKT